MSLTVSQKEDEIRKCIVDPVYFMETYCQIITDINTSKNSRRSKIKLFPFQKEFIKCCSVSKRVIILKPRQVGLSTITVLYLLHHCIFTTDAQVIVVSIDETEAQKFLYKANVAFQDLPEWLVGKLKSESASKLQFASDSFLEVRSASERAGRGLTCTKFVMDEAAFIDRKTKIKNVDDDLAARIWTSAKPSLGDNNQAIIISTPNGIGNFYHDTWLKAIEGTKYNGEFWRHGHPPEFGVNGFSAFTLGWQDFPPYDQQWFEKQKIEYRGRERALAQEVLRSFLGSGDLVISASVIEELEKKFVRPPITITDGLRIFEEPRKGEVYILGVDTASAKGADLSTIEVFNLRNKEQVAEFQGRLTTTAFGKKVNDVGKFYNNGLIVCEANGLGQATIDVLMQLSYNNIFKTKTKEGLHCTREVNEARIGSFKQLVEHEGMKLHSQNLIDELKTFVWFGNTGRAQGTNKDDLVAACTLASYAILKSNDAYGFNAIEYLAGAGDLIGVGNEWKKYLMRLNNPNDAQVNGMSEERRRALSKRIIMDLGISSDYIDAYNILMNNKW